MDDDGWILIVPLGTVLLIFGIAVLSGAGIVYQIREWFINNVSTIAFVCVIIGIVSAIITGIISRSILISVFHLTAISQFVFYLLYFGMRLPVPDSSKGIGNGAILNIIWVLFIFLLYVAYGILNICIIGFAGYAYLEVLTGYHKKKKLNKEDKKASILFNAAVCGGGWLINLIIYII